jgi:hypothetical protein
MLMFVIAAVVLADTADAVVGVRDWVIGVALPPRA